MKNGPLKGGGSCKYIPVIMQRFTHRRKCSFFGKKNKKRKKKKQKTKKQKKKKTRTTEHYDINCEVLLQEFNKHLLFIYNNSMF